MNFILYYANSIDLFSNDGYNHIYIFLKTLIFIVYLLNYDYDCC